LRWISLSRRVASLPALGRETENPEDVIPVHRRIAERLVQEKNNASYQKAAGVVMRLSP